MVSGPLRNDFSRFTLPKSMKYDIINIINCLRTVQFSPPDLSAHLVTHNFLVSVPITLQTSNVVRDTSFCTESRSEHKP